MEDFGPAAVGLVEDLLVNFPSRLGDVRPPFAEFGVLQVVVHFIFLPQTVLFAKRFAPNFAGIVRPPAGAWDGECVKVASS